MQLQMIIYLIAKHKEISKWHVSREWMDFTEGLSAVNITITLGAIMLGVVDMLLF